MTLTLEPSTASGRPRALRSAASARRPAGPTTQPSGLRPEIQLLRAVAVLAVVVNHLWPARLPGGYVGVDVFFVISGYLITAHLLRELDDTGRVAVIRFWARRARRLLPASLLVLAVSAATTALVVPQPLWPGILREISASALYVQNWALAAEARDYFASGDAVSPVTHYWSLSLEEQFYLLWPLMAFGAYAAGRRVARVRRHDLREPRTAVLVAFGAVVAASLAYAIWATTHEPQAAYFVTPARMWQLGAGGLLAAAPALTRGRRPVAIGGWLALAGSLWWLDSDSAVPGWISLAPVLATVAVLWAGDTPLAGLPPVLRPLRASGLWIGGISYALYLWHWPPIVLLPFMTGRPLTTGSRFAILVAAVLIAWLSTHLLENPVRRHRWLVTGPARRTFLPALCATVAVVLVGHLASAQVTERTGRVIEALERAAGSDPCLGAAAVAEGCANPHRLRYPDTALLAGGSDPTIKPRWGEECSQSGLGTRLVTCEFGVPREQAALRIALVGDSHARHWIPAMDELAAHHRWNVVLMTKTSCPVGTEPVMAAHLPEQAAGCRTWGDAVLRRLAEDHSIDVVVTSAKTGIYVIDGLSDAASHERMAAGYAAAWRQWTATGKTVVAIGDVPRLRVGVVPHCVAAAATRDDPCTTPATLARPADPMMDAARSTADPAIVPVDLDRYFCNDGICHAVIGGVVAYIDTNHLLGTFSRSLAPYLLEQMQPALPVARP